MTTKESNLFINEFLMGLKAHDYVELMLKKKSFVVSVCDDNDYNSPDKIFSKL